MSDETTGTPDAHEGFRRPEIRLDGRVVAPESAPAPPAPPAPQEPAAPPSSSPGRPPRASTRTRLLVGGLALALVAVAVPVALTVGGGDDEAGPDPAPTAEATPPAGDAFRQQVIQAFGSVGGVLNIYLQRELRAFRDGTSTSAQARTAFASVRPAAMRAREQLAALPPFEPVPASLEDYRAAGTVFVQAVDTGLVATRLPTSPLQGQLRLQAVRLQVLGDRLYDQGARDLTGFVRAVRTNSAVIIQPPAEVPDYTGSGLLAGAPLVPAPRTEVSLEPPTGANQQAVTSWVDQVAGVGVPSAEELARAIEGTDGPALGVLANRLIASALAVRELDDPASGRKDSTRVQLALYVQSEAARAAEAAVALPAGAAREQLLTIARTLAVQGDVMWDARLGPRDTGLPRDLLAVS